MIVSVYHHRASTVVVFTCIWATNIYQIMQPVNEYFMNKLMVLKQQYDSLVQDCHVFIANALESNITIANALGILYGSCSIPIASALEIPQSCTKPVNCCTKCFPTELRPCMPNVSHNLPDTFRHVKSLVYQDLTKNTICYIHHNSANCIQENEIIFAFMLISRNWDDVCWDIFLQGKQGPVYPTESVLCLLMTWWSNDQ